MRLILLFVFALAALPVYANPNVTLTIRPDMSGTNYGGPFLRGTEGAIYIVFENAGNFIGVDRSNVYVRLPSGLAYDRADPFTPANVVCSADAVEAGGQTVRCHGNGLSGNPNSINRTSAVRLWVDVAPDAPLGAAPIHAGFDDAATQPTGTLAACMANPAPANCDVLDAAIAVPPMPDIEILSVTHAPEVFAVGVADPRLIVTFRNRGTTATASTHIDLSLPPGLALAAGSGAAPLGMNCAVLATVPTGQSVRCSGGALLPPDEVHPRIVTLVVRLAIDAALATPGPVAVLIGADASGAASSNTLLDCSTNPDQDRCTLHLIGSGMFCADRIVPEGLYCDGFEQR